MIKWNKSNTNHQPRFKLEYRCHRLGPETRKFPSRLCFSELSNLREYSMEIVEFETFLRLKFSVSLRPRQFETANFQIYRDRDISGTEISGFSRPRLSKTRQKLSRPMSVATAIAAELLNLMKMDSKIHIYKR